MCCEVSKWVCEVFCVLRLRTESAVKIVRHLLCYTFNQGRAETGEGHGTRFENTTKTSL